MTALLLGLCALACPLWMLAMMWFTRRRGGHSHGTSEADKE